MQQQAQAFIHGRSVSNTNHETFTTYNPATNEPLCSIESSSPALIEEAINSAKKGFKVWSSLSGAARGTILYKAGALLRDRNDELAELETLETGKPIQESRAVDIHSAADCLQYFAGLSPTISGQHIPLTPSFAYTLKEPLGLCLGIGAWNYPIQIAAWKSAPALACGNVMLFKPSEHACLSTLKLAEIYSEAGLPDGVFNVLLGDARVGEALCLHPDIAKISLTGSVNTGKKIMALASTQLKKISLELGGKSALIIFEDANIDEAVSAAMMANFFTQGEICSNGTRVFVEETIKPLFLEKLITRTKQLILGSPMDRTTHIGALISKQHMEKVLRFIQSGIDEGAKLLCGGKQYKKGGCNKGFFVEPTVFDNCHDDMRIAKKEIFGPVMSVFSFNDETEVIDRANSTEYGLAAGVFTQTLSRAHRVVQQLLAGTCWINNYNVTPVEVPFGGNKHSGMGRENGLAAIEDYTQIKSVYVELGKVSCPYP